MRTLISLFRSATLKDTIFSLAGTGGVAVGGVLFTVVATRSLPPEKFGVFSALLAIATIGAVVADVGTSSALMNFIPKYKNKRGSVISTIFFIEIVATIVLITILTIFSAFSQRLVPGSTGYHFFLTTVLAATYIFSSMTVSLLRSERNFLMVAKLQILDSFTKLGIVYSYFIRNNLTIETAIEATIISSGLVIVLGLGKELVHLTIQLEKELFLEIFKFSKWMSLSQIFAVAIGRIDTILLAALASSFQAGIFAAGSRITVLFTLLISSLGSVITPRFASFTSPKQVTGYLKKIGLLLAAVSLAMISCTIFAPWIVEVIFGQKYLMAIPVFRYLTVATIPFLLSLLTVSPIVYYFNRPDFIAKITVLHVVLLIVLDLFLIPKYGAAAPAIALGVSNTTTLLITGYLLHHLLISWKK